VAGVAQFGCNAHLFGLGQVAGDRVDDVDLVAVRHEPSGVRAWATAHVEDPGGRRRQVAV
jgi:hypothetical protein